MFVINQPAKQYASAATVRHDFWINEEIGEATDYTDLLQTLHTATPQEHIFIHLNTPGGDFYTACQIVEAIRTSQAGMVVCCAEGIVASAGTIIFHAAHMWAVSEYATFMYHTSSGFSYGKLPDSLKAQQSHSEHLNRVCSDVYQGFFDEEEIDQILNYNQDVWLTPLEVQERLELVVETMEQADKEIQDQVNAAVEALEGTGLTVRVNA